MPATTTATRDALGRTLDALYWIRTLEHDLTQTAEQLVAQDPLPLTVDQRLDNMKKNRALIIEGLEGEYPPMSDGEKFAKAAERAAYGTEVDWIDALGTESYLAGEPLLPPSPFEVRQRGSDLER